MNGSPENNNEGAGKSAEELEKEREREKAQADFNRVQSIYHAISVLAQHGDEGAYTELVEFAAKFRKAKGKDYQKYPLYHAFSGSGIDPDRAPYQFDPEANLSILRFANELAERYKLDLGNERGEDSAT